MYPFNDAFTNPDVYVGDAFRILGTILGTIMLGMFLKVAREVRNTRQFGMYALVCFGISAIATQISLLGDTVTYQLPFNIAGTVFGLIFLYKTHKHKQELR